MKKTLNRSLTILAMSCSLLATAAHATSPSTAKPTPGGGHSGLPTPRTTLLADEVHVPFALSESFPVPIVEVSLNGRGPWRLAVDTAMGGTVLLRKELVGEMGLPVVGQAMVGDSSGTGLKPVDLVRINMMQLGQLEVREIIGIGFAAGEAHLQEVPDDIHGILGNQIYAELLMTLDYPGQELVFRSGELSATDPSVVQFEDQGKVMVVEMNVANHGIPVIVDSGSRGTITLPESLARTLPLRGGARDVTPVSTVSNTYQRSAVRLDGNVVLAGTTLVDPEIGFADEHTPKLIGYGVLKHFVLTIDQAHGRLRFGPTEKGSIEGITLEH